MKCQMPDGSVTGVLGGAEAAKAWASSMSVKPGTPQAWALATTAIIFEINLSRQDLLGGTIATPSSQAGGQRLLAKWWGISSPQDLMEMLTWLQYTGHRSDFEALGRQVDAMDEQQFINAKAEMTAEGLNPQKLEVVRQNYRQLSPKGILAWDLIRYVALCRWGYLAGYMSQEVAWKSIMSAALRLQQSFTSWQDLQTDYLIGRKFWSGTQTQKDGDRFQAVYDQFIHDPRSPWGVNPWSMNLSMNLGVITPLPIEAR